MRWEFFYSRFCFVLQEILYWQTRTIEMMYSRVGDALLQSGNNSHPTDWLLFLCPGKRENPGEHLDHLEPAVEPMARTFRDSLRFPIYVHSKMMIVDDAYIIVGSANINQVSELINYGNSVRARLLSEESTYLYLRVSLLMLIHN